MSKLTVKDDRFFGVQMDLFAYSILHPRKTDSSFVPGVAFTLSVKNPTQKQLNVSFLINMPLGEQPGTFWVFSYNIDRAISVQENKETAETKMLVDECSCGS